MKMDKSKIKYLVNLIIKHKFKQYHNEATHKTKIIDDKYIFIETKHPLTTEIISYIQKSLYHSQFIASNTNNTVMIFKRIDPEYALILHIDMAISLIEENIDNELLKTAKYLQELGYNINYYYRGEICEPTIEILIPEDTLTRERSIIWDTVFELVTIFASNGNISEEFLEILHIFPTRQSSQE